MIPGLTGKVCGRNAVIVAVFKKSIRVRYTEPSERSKMLDIPFTPFESNVPKSYWYRSNYERI